MRFLLRGEPPYAAEIDEDEDDEFARAADDDDDGDSGRAVPAAWRNKGFRLGVIATAFVLAAGLSFGVGRVFGLGNTEIRSAVPAPLQGDDVFVEDPDGLAQDNLSNALESTGQGMVHILSAGTTVGIGLVLTQSGKVLTPYQPAAGAANLTVEYVFSGKAFKATVIGVDPAAGLALLQLEGGNGRAFSTVTVGNSDTIVSSAVAIRQSSYHVPGDVIDTALSTTGTATGVALDVGKLTTLNMTVDIDGETWTGLLASTLPNALPWVLGDPLVNPNGHVIGIVIGNARSGSTTVAYAIPINGALAVAARLAG